MLTPINTSMMHDLIVFIFLLIIYFQMKCSHVMTNGKITYKGKEILLLFLLQNGYYSLQDLSGGAPDCLVRPSTAAFPNGLLVVEGYKYPQLPQLQASKSSEVFIQYKS
jgi:hypothetical protein